MPEDQVGPQAARLAALYAARYGWHPEEVTREIINAVEHRYQPDPRIGQLPLPASNVVARATAPPRRRMLSDPRDVSSSYQARAAGQQSRERG